mmetsp:Transcript_28946/g.76365  ORF Transcript_28946/g.76365 Transcript_28946/m.76365 type:complete len:145 (+) Transcript_28946:205-639(+)
MDNPSEQEVTPLEFDLRCDGGPTPVLDITCDARYRLTASSTNSSSRSRPNRARPSHASPREETGDNFEATLEASSLCLPLTRDQPTLEKHLAIRPDAAKSLHCVADLCPAFWEAVDLPHLAEWPRQPEIVETPTVADFFGEATN